MKKLIRVPLKRNDRAEDFCLMSGKWFAPALAALSAKGAEAAEDIYAGSTSRALLRIRRFGIGGIWDLIGCQFVSEFLLRHSFLPFDSEVHGRIGSRTIRALTAEALRAQSKEFLTREMLRSLCPLRLCGENSFRRFQMARVGVTKKKPRATALSRSQRQAAPRHRAA